MFSMLFRMILTVHLYKNISFWWNTDFSCQIVLQEEFAEEPHTYGTRQTVAVVSSRNAVKLSNQT